MEKAFLITTICLSPEKMNTWNSSEKMVKPRVGCGIYIYRSGVFYHINKGRKNMAKKAS